MIFDLRHKFASNMPAYPGLLIPKFHVFLAHGDATFLRAPGTCSGNRSEAFTTVPSVAADTGTPKNG
jgi:hypothetical protein